LHATRHLGHWRVTLLGCNASRRSGC
jgi:hypothetical protein